MRSRIRGLFFILPGLWAFSSVLCAEIVTEVGKDGTLTLESGKQVVLAGVEMDPEGISVLRVLAQKQDVRLQLLAQAAPEAKAFAYVYLKAKYLKFPAKLGATPDEQEVLINEFMVKIGAAKVAAAQVFSRKARFLKVQEESKKKGEGIWSYEVP